MNGLKDFYILDLTKGESGQLPGYYFAFPDEYGSLDEMYGPFQSRYAAALRAIEFTADIFLATEEQGN